MCCFVVVVFITNTHAAWCKIITVLCVKCCITELPGVVSFSTHLFLVPHLQLSSVIVSCTDIILVRHTSPRFQHICMQYCCICLLQLFADCWQWCDSASHCRSADKGVNIDKARNLSASKADFKFWWREAHVEVKQVDELSFEWVAIFSVFSYALWCIIIFIIIIMPCIGQAG